MKKGTKIIVTLHIKNEEGETISKMDNRKGIIQNSANKDNSAYYIKFNDSSIIEAVSTKYITKVKEN